MPTLGDFSPNDLSPVEPAQAAPATAQVAAPQTSSPKLSDFQPEDLVPVQQEGPGLGSKLLHGAGKVLGYLGGIERTGVGSVASVLQNLAQGKVDDVIKPKDVMNALKGNAVSGEEILKRMGVGKGMETPQMPLPFTDASLPPISVRDAAGFGVDVLTDPIAEVSKMAKALPIIGKAINASNEATSALGKAIYKSAFTEKAGKAAESMLEGVPGKIAPSMTVGTEKKLAEKMIETSQVMGGVRTGLYQQAEAVGARIKPTDMNFTRSQGIIDDMLKSRNSSIRAAAEDAQQMLNDFKAGGEASLEEASTYKTQLNQNLPKSFFAGTSPKPLPIGKRVSSAMAQDLRDMIVDVGNKGGHGLGDAIEEVNSKWGPLLGATPEANKIIAKPITSRFGQTANAIALAAGGVKGLGLKLGFDAVTSAPSKTAIGAGLMKAAQAGIPAAVVNQGLSKVAGNAGVNTVLRDNEQ